MLAGQKRKRSMSIGEAITKTKEKIDVIRYTFAVATPSAITCMTLERSSGLCAVARMNGQIELWKTTSWTLLLKIPGQQESIRNLHFYQENDKTMGILGNIGLISTSLNGNITKYNLRLLKAMQTVNDTGSGIWDSDLNGDSLFLACDDGSVRIYSLESLTFIKMLPRQKAKTLCVLQSRFHQKVLLAGYNDSSIRAWDLENYQLLRRMSIAPEGAVYIWRLVEITTTEIVSGDSMGCVRVWDSINFVEIKSFKEHKGDVVALACHNHILYATGIDSKIVSFSRTESAGWITTSNIRGQSHDINSLQVLSENEIISGGVTTDICVYPLVEGRFKESFGASAGAQSKLRHVPPFSLESPVSLTRANDFLLMHSDNELLLWEVPSITSSPVLQLKIKKKALGAIYSSAISNNLGFVCFSDARGLFIYKVAIAPPRINLLPIKGINDCQTSPRHCLIKLILHNSFT